MATREGYLECVSVQFEHDVEAREIIVAWENDVPLSQELQLPPAPRQALIYCCENNRPQTLLDRDAERDMTFTLSRLRHCPILVRQCA